MFSRIRKRFTYANVAMTLALVFAMSGGAYAAGKYVITSTKQIKPSVLKQLKGANGATGAQGPAGPTGPTGPAGSTGPAGAGGKDGSNGENGASGTNGTSVSSAKLASGNATCKAGGSEFTAEGKKTFACTGEKGEKGEEGNIKKTLPQGVTETGPFAVSGAASEVTQLGTVYLISSLSFTIPLAAAPTSIHLIGNGEQEGVGAGQENPAIVAKECTGTAAAPGAASGNLCIFLGYEVNVDLNKQGTPPAPVLEVGHTLVVTPAGLALGANTTGALLFIHPEKETEKLEAWGTWAVTG